VQYNDFQWTYFQFKRFDTFFYKGGKELAEFTGRTANAEIDEIEKLFDYNTQGRLQFIIFNKLSDLKQTNLGLESESQLNNTGGVFKSYSNKILIYFDGDHEHFRQQIRGGIAQVLFEQLMYGGNVKDRLQSSLLLNVPDWYINGLTLWVAKGWKPEDENKMRDGILSGKHKKFNTLVADDPDFAGQSIWNFVNETYGPASVANMLYMTRLNRNIESGFNFVIGTSLREISNAWLVYYEKKYLDNDNGRQQPNGKPLSIKNKSRRIVNQFKLSPDGNKAAYVTNELGKYRVYVYDLKSGHKKKVAKGGYKSVVQKTDDSFPLLAWQPSGKSLTMIKEKKGNLWLDIYNLKNRKTDRSKLLYFEKVHDFSYSDDGQNIVMSATQKGQSDLFVWNVRARASTQITKDLYDDLQPHFTNGSSKIIFTSNRVNDTLGAGNFYKDAQKNKDVFLYDYASGAEILARITNTPGVDEYQPMEADSSRYIYLSEANGIRNRHLATVDSTISFVDTVEHYRFIVRTFSESNYTRSVIQHDINYRHNKYAELFINKTNYTLVVNPLPQPELSSAFEIQEPVKTAEAPKSKQKSISDLLAVKMLEEQKVVQPDSNKVDINNYVFQSEFKRKSRPVEQPATITSPVTAAAPPAAVADSTPPYRLPKQRNYDLSFSRNYSVTQLDNSLLNPTYQAYTGGATYFDPGLSVLFMIGINDLMDDYKLVGGFRLPFDLRLVPFYIGTTEYYASFENLKKKVDKTISFYRLSHEESVFVGGAINEFAEQKTQTHDLQYKFKFPFNNLTSIRTTFGLRYDKEIVLSTSQKTLELPNVNTYWGSAKAEFVYDNTINTGVNLMRGVRYKIFGEVFSQEKKNTWLSVVGADVRTYTKISRQIIWANRFAASTSMGDYKLIYYLGSIDNVISPSNNFDAGISVDASQDYKFQAAATNMRGFRQNIRNGNSFALINSEVRIPVFQYFSPTPIRSDFLRNFMVVPFFDIGTAWTSSSPYSKDNNLNLEVIVRNPLIITINKNTDPLVAGYGFGLRSRLFGYYLRFDWGWNYADGEYSKKALFNFSLSLDF